MDASPLTSTDAYLELSASLDSLWVGLTAVIIFAMQLGFTVYEVGTISRNSDPFKILLKNVTDSSVSLVAWSVCGYGIAKGDGSTQGRLRDLDHGLMCVRSTAGIPAAEPGEVPPLLEFFFGWAFASSAVTIVSGSVAERVPFPLYLILSSLTAALVYPFVAWSIWSNHGWLSLRKGGDYGLGCGVLDFAGSGAVHMLGGLSSLFWAAILGPRVNRFLGGKVNFEDYGDRSESQKTLGMLLLWFGW
ncbi:unnamed protein product [Discosporangium mesarthrocarpum]